MATIRFIREDLEVQCNPGENLRELVMKENLQLYGLKVFWEIVEALDNAVLVLFRLKVETKIL